MSRMTDCCINITIGRGRPKVLQATSLMLRGGCCYYSAYILQYRQKSQTQNCKGGRRPQTVFYKTCHATLPESFSQDYMLTLFIPMFAPVIMDATPINASSDTVSPMQIQTTTSAAAGVAPRPLSTPARQERQGLIGQR